MLHFAQCYADIAPGANDEAEGHMMDKHCTVRREGLNSDLDCGNWKDAFMKTAIYPVKF